MAVGDIPGGDTFNPDEADGHEEGGERGPHGDPPPRWDGEDVAKRWKKYKRELLLWQNDTHLLRKRQGLKVWRRLSGKAADIVDLLVSGGARACHMDGLCAYARSGSSPPSRAFALRWMLKC